MSYSLKVIEVLAEDHNLSHEYKAEDVLLVHNNGKPGIEFMTFDFYPEEKEITCFYYMNDYRLQDLAYCEEIDYVDPSSIEKINHWLVKLKSGGYVFREYSKSK